MADRNDIRRKMFDLYEPEPIKRETTALLIIDMQYYDAHADYGICRRAKDEKRIADLQHYIQRLEQIVPRISQLQEQFRSKGLEVIHTRIASLTQDGRDRSRQHKEGGVHVPPDSKEAQILEELQPVGDEIVFSKTAGNVFLSTNIDYVLRNLGITQLVIVGVVTHGCVEDAVRSASGIGYKVRLVEDACASYNKELHDSAIRELGVTLATVTETAEVIRELDALP